MFFVRPEGKPLDVGGRRAVAWLRPWIIHGPRLRAKGEGDGEMAPVEGPCWVSPCQLIIQ